MTKRLQNWQSALQACIAERRCAPFAWGSQDCVLFAADCVRAITGEDPADGIRGTYSDAAGAAHALKERGGLAAVAAGALGAEVLPIMAQPGDIGVVINGGRECLAVCVGKVWVGPGASGLVTLPPASALRAWRVVKVGV